MSSRRLPNETRVSRSARRMPRFSRRLVGERHRAPPSLPRRRELLLRAVHAPLVVHERLVHGVDVLRAPVFAVHPHLAFHERAREQHRDLALVDVEAVRVRVLLEEVHRVHRVLVLHAVVDLHVVHHDVLRFQPARDSVVPLARRDVCLGHRLEVGDVLLRDGVLVHVAVQVPVPDAPHEVPPPLQRRLLAPLDALQDGVVELHELLHVPNRVRDFVVPHDIRLGERVHHHVLDALRFFVRVHLLVQRRARVEQLVHVVHLRGLEADLVVDHLHKAHQARNIHAPLDAGVVRVAHDVLKLVHVHRVALVGDNVPQELLIRRRVRVVRGDQIPHALDHLRVDVDVVVLYHPLEHVRAHGLVSPGGVFWVPARVPARQKLVVEDVAERAVPEVVAQARELDGEFVHVRQILANRAAAAPPQALVHVRREVARAQRVLEPVVRRSGEDVVGRAELLQLAKTLDLRCVDGVAHQPRKVHVPVHGVDDDLPGARPAERQSLLLRGERRLLVRQLGHRRKPLFVFVQVIAGASGLRRVEQIGVLFRGRVRSRRHETPLRRGRHLPSGARKGMGGRDRPFKPNSSL
mmetsp:Transcript_5524/g.22364  ORF Transcript_5524/g.22364 Transcript_5524/m.22364 type:complete len:579 (+) Transcript_5524:20-1756(+)